MSTEYSVPQEKIFVLPHSILENIKTSTKEKARKELNLSGNVYLLIGTMVPDHGHDIVIEQADKIGKLILVATNPSAINDRNEGKISGYLTKNQEVVKAKGFDKFVRFDIGPISNEKWWKYFSAADLILLPYRGGIGSGIFADAMALKKPVVTSNVKYFKEFAKDYKCIEIAKTDSDFPCAIKHAMSKEVYSSMVKEAKRFAEENGTENISKRYKEFYSSLVSQEASDH